MSLHDKALAAEHACAGLEDEVEGVFCVHRKTRDLRASHLQRTRYGACLVSITIEGERTEF